MKIAIATSGRFHVLDLARELSALGHAVLFYSLVPPWRTARFGLPTRCNRWILPWVLPAYTAARFARGQLSRDRAAHLLAWCQDLATSRALEPCDVFVGMSGMFTRAAEAARRKFGATILVERGSRHILSQRRILDALRPAGSPSSVPDWQVARELADYSIADRIVIPSRHVAESFAEFGIGSDKLFVNPYGVSLESFGPTPPPHGPPTVLNVGTWSFQKGADVLAEAMRQVQGAHLLHVGSMGDAPFPTEQAFRHVAQVDQLALPAFYAQGDVFALASRQDGFGMVLAQALASGLRVVCTSRTGGADLRAFVSHPDAITVVPPDDPEALARGIERALTMARSEAGPRDLLGPAREQLSWAAYGRRYERFVAALRPRL